MMYALMLPVLLFGAGFAVDYTHAMQVQTKLDAAADAAALAALTPAMMQQSNAAAQTAATNLFNAEANAQGSLVAGKTNVTVTVTTPTGSPLVRNVTVSYTAANTNIFAGVLGYSALGLAGSSTATASAAANMNFYLLLDNSPSMALPATSAGITQMENLTKITATTKGYQGWEKGAFQGCAFACHQAIVGNPDTAGNPCADGTAPTINGSYTDYTTGQSSPTEPMYCDTTKHGAQIDNFALARKNNIQLRLDALNTGISDLTAYAEQFRTQQASPPTYEFAAYEMDSSWQIGMSSLTSPQYNQLMGLTTSYVSGWSTASANFGVMEYYSNNHQCGNAACTSDGGGGDWATNYDNALGAMNTIMPNPGQGTTVAGDKPKEVLFLVTDGVEDELNAPSCSQLLTGSRCQSPINPSLCTTIKNRGIYIAILYTDYYPVTANGTVDNWYTKYVSPYNAQPSDPTQPPTQSLIYQQLQNCASPGMFIEAGLDGNLSAGLEALFANVMSARLTQ
jgi:Flp pilus assembly protein TadG